MNCTRPEEIVAKIKKSNDGCEQRLSYQLDGKPYAIDYDNLFELVSPSGSGYCYKKQNNNIHFFDLSNSDLNHIMGVCAFLYCEDDPISKECGDFILVWI